MKQLFSKFLVAYLPTSAVVLSWSEYFYTKITPNKHIYSISLFCRLFSRKSFQVLICSNCFPRCATWKDQKFGVFVSLLQKDHFTEFGQRFVRVKFCTYIPTCFPWLVAALDASAKADITLPRVTKLLLIWPPSLSL